jgi:hypothetical protein
MVRKGLLSARDVFSSFFYSVINRYLPYIPPSAGIVCIVVPGTFLVPATASKRNSSMGCTYTSTCTASCFWTVEYSEYFSTPTPPLLRTMTFCSVNAPNTQYNEDSSSTFTLLDSGSRINTLYLCFIHGTIVQYSYNCTASGEEIKATNSSFTHRVTIHDFGCLLHAHADGDPRELPVLKTNPSRTPLHTLSKQSTCTESQPTPHFLT